MTTDEKSAAIEKLRQEILEQKVCSDLAKQAKNLVMGDGDLDADIVFIGEAPGKNEDEQGLPFVGAAGKFLNEMLESAGLKREEVYITNIVKYRPPNNRDPEPEEKREFWPFLLKQLEIIQPQIIATLGRHSMEYFLPDARISVVHGKPRRIHAMADGREFEWVIMPLFHPAAALYNGAMRETLMEDFAKLPSIIKQIKTRDDVLKIMAE